MDISEYDNESFKLLHKKKAKVPLKIIIGIISSALLISLCLILVLFVNNGKNVSPEKPSTLSIGEEEDLNFTEVGHRKLSRQFATEGMVLASNKGLPIEKDDQVVLFGDGTVHTYYGGQGSGVVLQKGTFSEIEAVKVLTGMEHKAKKEKFIYIKNEKGYEIGGEGSSLTDGDVANFAKKTGGAKRSVAVLSISRISGEGEDRPEDQSNKGTKLKDSEKATFNSLVNHFDKVVVVLNVGSIIELEGWEKNEKVSILIAFLPGVEAGHAIADILVGDVNPSGHLTDTWANTIADYPTTNTFKESITFVKYREGLFVGYRYFEDDEKKQSKIVFPFGHGLSYTSFKVEYSCVFNKEKEMFIVSGKVTNTGGRAGKQVLQVYVEKAQNPKFIKVKRELVAFTKTKLLDPNETQELEMTINLSELSSYDDTGVTGNKACYVIEKGVYKLYAGSSVADTRSPDSLIFTYEAPDLRVIKKLSTRLKPKDPDVADANTKPDFDSFMYDNYKGGKQDDEVKVYEKNITIEEEQYPNHEYVEIPTDKVAPINFKTVLEKKHTMKELVEQMSNEELAYLSFGHGANGRSAAGGYGGNYNAGMLGKYLIPNAEVYDGPAGIRQGDIYFQSVAWPCSTLLASTFDIDVLRIVGEETGKELRKQGGGAWLSPGMNIHRSPLCGRNFEYYSEDPLITGKMAANIAKGLQSKRVGINLKHFAFNNKERNRDGSEDPKNLEASDSRMAERVAREIYLKGFEIAVKEGNPWTLMCSYNRMNGMRTSESYDLMTGILRNEWGFYGITITDWGGTSRNDRQAHAGLTIQMPGNGKDGLKILANGLKTGAVSRDQLIKNCVESLETIAKFAVSDKLLKPDNIIKIQKEGVNHLKVFNSTFNKAIGIGYQDCQDEDKGYNLIDTTSNSWVTIMVDVPEDMMKQIRIRYSAIKFGFSVIFKRYEETLGELIDLDVTGEWQNWRTSPEASIFLPKGTYELTLLFARYDYKMLDEDKTKGNINWIEIF